MGHPRGVPGGAGEGVEYVSGGEQGDRSRGGWRGRDRGDRGDSGERGERGERGEGGRGEYGAAAGGARGASGEDVVTGIEAKDVEVAVRSFRKVRDTC